MRAAPGASGRVRLVGGAKAPAGLAIDSSHVYWANYGGSTIGRARLDGSRANEQFVKTSAYSTIGVAVDTKHIYWTSSGFDIGSGWIARADLDGSHIDRRFIRAGDSPTGIVVARRAIYWAHRDAHPATDGLRFSFAIGRASFDGRKVQRDFIRIPTAIDGVAANGRYVFWANNGEHVIGRANLDGTDVRQRCIDVQARPLETVPESLTADSEHVYWTNYPADTIGRANLDGSRRDDRYLVIDGVPEGIAVQSRDNASVTPVGCRSTKPALLLGPVGQSVTSYASGWGEVAPAVISNGGAAASGTISDIHWSRWAGKVAAGRGLHPTYTPHGGYFRKPVVIELRASSVRRCKPRGRLVYTRLSAREQVRPGGRMGKWFDWASNMCVGFR